MAGESFYRPCESRRRRSFFDASHTGVFVRHIQQGAGPLGGGPYGVHEGVEGGQILFKKEVSVADLDKSVRDAFFFQEEILEFWFDFALKSEGGNVEGFVKIGRLFSRGSNQPSRRKFTRY